MLYYFGFVLYSVFDCMIIVKNVEFKLCGLYNIE